MGKYDPLFRYFSTCTDKQISLNYTQIEDILSDKLPKSSYTYNAWWGNNSHAHSKSWIDAGYKVEEVILGNKILFVKE